MKAALAPLPEDLPTWVEDSLHKLDYYSRTALVIKNKGAHIVAFEFNEAQAIVGRKIAQQVKDTGRVRAIILKARQLGMSTWVAARFFRRCHLIPNQRAAIIADKKERAGSLFGIYERFDKNLDPRVRPRRKAAARSKHLVYDAPEGGLGSELYVETAGDTNAGRGSTIQLLHVSELAFWERAEDVWVSLMQSVPDNDSEIIVESTANGVGGVFHELWEAAEAGDNDFLPIFLPWFIHAEYQSVIGREETEDIRFSLDPFEREAQDFGIEWEGKHWQLTPAQLAWRRRTIRDKLRGDERAFRQEYPATSREAFLVSGASFFDEEALLDYERSARPPISRGNLVDVGGGGFILQPGERGYLRVWEFPRKEGLYAIFADTAEGKMVATSRGSFGDPESERGGRDFCAAYVYDLNTASYVALIHGRMAPEVFTEQLLLMGFWYTSAGRTDQGNTRVPAFLAVERNHSSGETVLRLLRDDHAYPNLYFHRTVNRRRREVTSTLGWLTNGDTRGPLLDDFAAAVRQGKVAIPDSDLVREMVTFVRGQDGKPQAQSGCHDDRVIAAAGCLQIARFVAPPVLELPREIEHPGWIESSYEAVAQVAEQSWTPEPDWN